MTATLKNLDRLHYPEHPATAREEVLKLLRALVEDFGAERIVVFGSFANGNVTEHSDLDLLVVRDNQGATHPTLQARLSAARSGARLSKDILVRTPRQFKEAQKRPFGVMEEVTAHGITVFEKS